MGGGILNGLILGLVVSGVVLGAVSLSTPLPERPGAGPGAEPAGQASAPDPVPAVPVVAPPATEAPTVPDAQAPEAGTMPDADPADAVAPVLALEPASGLALEPAPDAVPEAVPEPEAALAPPTGETEGTSALAPPSADPAPSLPRLDTPPQATSPVPPAPVPILVEDTAPEAQTAAAAPGARIATLPEAPAPAAIATAPDPVFSTTADASTGGAPPRRLAVPQVQDTPAATDTSVPRPAPEALVDPVSAAASEPVGPIAADPAPAPETPRRLPQVAPAPAPAPDLLADLVTVPRPDDPPLPALPPLPQPGDAGTDPETAPGPQTRGDPGPPNALRDHALAFEADPLAPLMAVVLIDDPQTPLDPATLTDLSFPVSFAIDPMRPDATERAAAFRAAGFEVVILGATALPDGATPADVEVALAVAQERLPEAVALMDDPAGRIQGDRPVLDATVGALAATGHGLLAFPRGLNAAEETAQRTGVPAATFFRLLDDEDQRAPVITRFLGRAAFAAAQEGAVVVAGRTRPDTVTALFSWALANRTEGVVLAPVSAVLQRLSE